jgi:ribosomal protein S4
MYMRTFGDLAAETNFTRTNKTLFQTTWFSKTLARGYHGDWIQEKKFKDHYLPPQLPPIKTPEGKPQVPLGTMVFVELERRIDVALFRACLAKSVYQARNAVLDGHVTINGKEVSPLAPPFFF